MSTTLNTPKFRIDWPKIFQPEKNDLNGKMEYSCVALFPLGADLSELKAAAEAAAIKKFGPDKSKWPDNIRNPFKDQGEKRVKDQATGRPKVGADGKPIIPDGYVAGAPILNFKSEQRPGVVDANVQTIMDPSEIYRGCYCVAQVNAFAYDIKGNRGISFGLNNLQKVGDGDSLGGRMKPEDAFAPVAAAAGAGAAKSAAASFLD